MKFTTALFAAMFSFASVASAQMAVTPGGNNVTYELKSHLSARKVFFHGAQNTPHYRDYFGLFRAGSETRLEWCYLDGTKVVDVHRLMSTGACTFNVAPGNYSARVYSAGMTTTPLASLLFTVDQPSLEFRSVVEDGTVTINRINDKTTINRSADGSVMTLITSPATTIKQRKTSYTGETVTSVLPVAPTKAGAGSKAVNP